MGRVLHSLFVSCLAWGNPALGSTGSMVGLMMTWKKAHQGAPPRTAVASACDEPLLTHTSIGDPPTLLSRSGSVSCGWGGVPAPFPWVLVCSRFCLCSPSGCLCFPQSCGSPVIKSHWPSQSDSREISSPFAGSPGWEAWCGARNLHNSGRRSLVLLFSSLWVARPVGMGFDFIMISFLLLSCCSFSFVFGYEVSFCGGFQHPPVDDCSTATCDLVLSQEEMNTCSYTQPSWTPR